MGRSWTALLTTLMACLASHADARCLRVSVCDDGWVYNNATRTCYKTLNVPMDMPTALNACSLLGARLPSVHSQYENDALAAFLSSEWQQIKNSSYYINAFHKTADLAWLSLVPKDLGQLWANSNCDDDSYWKWMDNSPANFLNSWTLAADVCGAYGVDLTKKMVGLSLAGNASAPTGSWLDALSSVHALAVCQKDPVG